MNYLRGAVSAISAPYQYYKDLNPSTLTGAIDVIVVRRPKNLPEHPTQEPVGPLSEEDTELVCSPFHVRFGKWQVLRPQDKKVRLQWTCVHSYSPLNAHARVGRCVRQWTARTILHEDWRGRGSLLCL